jgi:membrane protein DedA with SNARE-associated domain
MPPELILYITKYGYYAIFVLVFLQEIGAPNPIPNELVLLFSGYLTFTGVLQFPLVVLAALSADFIGTSILHTVFYFSGACLFQHKPRWLPIPMKTILKLKKRISHSGLWGIYIGRLTPFIRGYTSVIAGLLQIKSRVFLPIALVTATIWASIYVTAGRLLGPLWSHVAPDITIVKYSMLLIFISIIAITILRSFIRHKTVKNEDTEEVLRF